MDRRIAEYISANRGRYTREAIRQHLIDEGYDAAAVDATWAVLDTPDPDTTAGEGFWRPFWLILLGVNLAVFVLVLVSTGLVGSLVGGGATFIVVIFALALVIGALVAYGIVAAIRPAQLGRTTALAIGAIIPLAFALLIGGACYTLIGAVGTPPPPPTSGVMELHIDPPLAFDGSGEAGCQGSGAQGGFNVYANHVGEIDGMPVSVSVDAYTEAPGSEALIPNLFITLGPVPGQQQPVAYFGGMPGSQIEIDATPDGLSGTLQFEGLTAQPMEGHEGGVAPAPDPVDSDPISGTVSWQCESGGRP